MGPALDEHERRALARFLHLLEEGAADLQPQADAARAFRGPDGHIVVPVRVSGREPNMGIALLMAQKAEQVYKQTGSRFVLAQHPIQDLSNRLYIWTGEAWKPVAGPAPTG